MAATLESTESACATANIPLWTGERAPVRQGDTVRYYLTVDGSIYIVAVDAKEDCDGRA